MTRRTVRSTAGREGGGTAGGHRAAAGTAARRRTASRLGARGRALRAVSLASVLTLTVAGCSVGAFHVGGQPPAVPVVVPGTTAAAATPAPSTTAPPPVCNPEAVSPAPAAADAGNAQVQAIKARGKLIVGVAPDDYLTGNLNGSGQEVGFDVDIARQVEKALFGTTDDAHIEFRAVTLPERISDLQNGTVDIVVDTMTITCARTQQVTFSSVYYEAEQKLLVESSSGIKLLSDLGPKDKVCAQTGSTNAAVISAAPSHPGLYTVDNLTDCLTALQEGTVQAVSTDDVILAGLAVQDPNTAVVGGSLASEPYGIAVKHGDTALAGFVNGVLAQIRSDGTWEGIYGKWLQPALGPAQPPTAHYAG